ncbi:hypothetical protein [Myroides odoratus]|uniref:hypothetical protein n=1 Tax=Myroides odoratus TaxID=256 RepID=UPI0039B0606A
MQKTYILILFYITNSLMWSTIAQNLNKEELIQHLKASPNTFFVINGNVFSPEETTLQEELNKIDPIKIVSIDLLKTADQFFCIREDTIVINYAYDLPSDQIGSKLKEIVPRFVDEYYGYSAHFFSNAKNPVLYINGHKIQHTEAKKLINELKASQIAYIYANQTLQSVE